jgi:predicted DsbA family dithiol-disulfide isomerase
LDPEQMALKVAAGEYRRRVDEQIAEARGLGISGVPAFIFEERYAIVGAEPYEVFQETMARLTRELEKGAQT